MNREEFSEVRKQLYDRIEKMRQTGDYGAGASDIREIAEIVLKLADHMLERLRT